MDHKAVLKEFKCLVEKYGASFVAYRLGFSTSQSVEAWVRRKSIPRWFLIRADVLFKEINEVAIKEGAKVS